MTELPETAKLIAFLTMIGAGRTGHSRRHLMDHLLGTFELLDAWGCDRQICLAGGLHSIYGTNLFPKESLQATARLAVASAFGAEAERLAWIFGSIDRPLAIERGYGSDRRRNVDVSLNPNDLMKLRLIEAANLLEQGGSLDRWPNIKGAMLQQVERMSVAAPNQD